MLGDRLILTKPIGTGIMTTAAKQQLIDRQGLQETIAIMSALNNVASKIMMPLIPTACTDITGYGLVGHAAEMAKASSLTVRIDSKAVPHINRVFEFIQKGSVPGGTETNRAESESYTSWAPGITSAQQTLLCDAQTSGGLLISINANFADQLLANLISEGVTQSTIIGELTPASPYLVEVC